ncbi:MAG TPA: rhombotarget lipoprotein, partial [Steroidobacteraceae bacterium]|nr:rhombotarget lipoprotein [Steroidobacteraceae bacterium]
GLNAAQREELMSRIRQRFADRKFIAEITEIPDYYLKTTRGFEGLQGVQRLYNVDVMALVSYDQVAHLDDNDWSLGYLTIVGAFVLKGSHHDLATLVDLAVIDPTTRSLILRAGGTDMRRHNTTLIDQERDSRTMSAESFAAATNQMINNFDVALTRFETDVREHKARVRVVNRNNGGGSHGGGGGAIDATWFAVLLGIALLQTARRKLLR